MEKASAFFYSYDSMVAEFWEKNFSPAKNRNSDNNDDNFESMLNEAVKMWEKTPAAELGGISPAEYIHAISDLDELIELVKTGSTLADNDLPGLLADRLREFGTATEEKVMGLALDKSMISAGGDGAYIPLSAIRLLGTLKVERAAQPLVSLIVELDEENELFMDSISSSLFLIGTASIGPTVKSLEEVKDFGQAQEFLLSSLGAIGEAEKNDVIYRCLKNSFIKMKDKEFGAALLGDYGDGRAIPVLKGFAQKNIGILDRKTFYGIKHAVEQLGGSMEDVTPPK